MMDGFAFLGFKISGSIHSHYKAGYFLVLLFVYRLCLDERRKSYGLRASKLWDDFHLPFNILRFNQLVNPLTVTPLFENGD